MVSARTDCPTEETEQTCLFRWAAYSSGAHPELQLLHAIPNGGLRSKSEAGRMKAAGVRAGVPDMLLPVARGDCHGLYIELKRRQGGRVSPEQVAWMEALTRQGYACAVCRGWEAAKDVITKYLLEGAGTHAAGKAEEDHEGTEAGDDLRV